ncbi:hypothetical protein HED60_04775 [Planctomycetales bacterium ZRK34]|nr:hypothetical protein HED60_04775 [Planctomycetales bacterium ZRK34]
MKMNHQGAKSTKTNGVDRMNRMDLMAGFDPVDSVRISALVLFESGRLMKNSERLRDG